MYTNIIHNDDICNYFLKNQQFIFNSLGNCRECRLEKQSIGQRVIITLKNGVILRGNIRKREYSAIPNSSNGKHLLCDIVFDDVMVNVTDIIELKSIEK